MNYHINTFLDFDVVYLLNVQKHQIWWTENVEEFVVNCNSTKYSPWPPA